MQAMRVAYAMSCGELVEAVIAPAAAEAATAIVKDAHEDVERTSKYLARLQEVRLGSPVLNMRVWQEA